ncbi:ABC transporter substrate-binding protein [Variovorax guangxiensis]|uniref:ABC transporter substrate-binding protein n=1 Tax=Variovorax guangxiensis TaxID=1775474 RepID=UPI00286556F7|nr:ABC transporter substrate-binding protein [Variovorax guangxiensis]MDR6861247.1 branched-chain amino acid transport system substrate-binding protein [Variovorax guangxiensis]
MTRSNRLISLFVLAASLASGAAVHAQQVVKVGIVGPFSGPFASSFGTPFRQGIEAYVAQNGDKAGATRVEFVYRDLDAPNPERAKALAQELIVKEKVQYLGGFVFTPNALAVAPLIQSAKVPTVIFNASTSTILSKSDYFVRTSNTLPQVTVPVAKYALDIKVKRVVTVVSDYGPGVDAENAFRQTFQAGGGEVVESIRMPLNATDFGPFLQKIRALKPDALFAFLPFGPPTFGFVKAYDDNGLKAAGIRFLGTSETQESDLQALGDAALKLETGYYYSGVHESAQNKTFVATLAKLKAAPNPATVAAFDGTHVLYKMIEATGGTANGKGAIDAVKGMAWESPRGPMKIDAETRDVIQNVYMRVVEKQPDGRFVNRETKTYAAQPDYGLQLKK